MAPKRKPPAIPDDDEELIVTPKRGNKGGPVLAPLPGPAAEPEVLEGVTDEWTTAEENTFKDLRNRGFTAPSLLRVSSERRRCTNSSRRFRRRTPRRTLPTKVCFPPHPRTAPHCNLLSFTIAAEVLEGYAPGRQAAAAKVVLKPKVHKVDTCPLFPSFMKTRRSCM